MFKRKLYAEMKKWKQESNGKTALLIEGPRRVGKSTLVAGFAENEYDSYILVDFVSASEETFALFDDMSNLNRFFTMLQLYYHTTLVRRKSLIIFDEVQLCPKARQAIKVLVKDGRYDYMETGSLISIKKNIKNIVVPSEERKMRLNPLDYEEFLWALGDETTNNLLHSLFLEGKPLGQDLHRHLMRDFRLYMLIGGMPQAVEAYLETNNLQQVDVVKRDILNLYYDDFRRIDGTGRLSMVFQTIPSQLNNKAKAFQIKKVIDSYDTGDEAILTLIADLKDSQTVNVSYHVNDPAIDLSDYKDLSRYKIYVCDTGLFVTMGFLNKSFTENLIYQKLLNDKLDVNLGYLYENVVAQILTSQGNELFYHTFEDKVQKRNFEVDFILPKGNKLFPIEVKSSDYRTHTSLDEFQRKYSSRIGTRYIIHTKDISRDKDILCVPVYMAQFLCQ